MREVANIFGVELGEEFKCNNGFRYKFTEKGVVSVDLPDIWCYPPAHLAEEHYKAALMSLLNGDMTIVPKPWKPKYEDKYYSVGVGGTVEDGTWLNDFLDYSLYKIGNCYRTPEEARENIHVWGKFYDSDEVLKISKDGLIDYE